ncbi:MAG: Maf family protein [Streptosporangiaceae bacterium]
MTDRMTTQPRPRTLVLASGSAGRLRVLRDAGFAPEVQVSGVDESTDDGLDTAAVVSVLAERKAAAVAGQCPDALVLGCDTLLDFEQTAFGKPASAEQAEALWQRLSGRQATLLTGHCLIDTRRGLRAWGVGRTVVRFGTPSAAELAAYVATGEPMQVAGGFSIDGFAAPFIEGVDGDPNNVIGLSLPLLRRLLADLGLAITDLWRPARSGLPYAGRETAAAGAAGPGTVAPPGSHPGPGPGADQTGA